MLVATPLLSQLRAFPTDSQTCIGSLSDFPSRYRRCVMKCRYTRIDPYHEHDGTTNTSRFLRTPDLEHCLIGLWASVAQLLRDLTLSWQRTTIFILMTSRISPRLRRSRFLGTRVDKSFCVLSPNRDPGALANPWSGLKIESANLNHKMAFSRAFPRSKTVLKLATDES